MQFLSRLRLPSSLAKVKGGRLFSRKLVLNAPSAASTSQFPRWIRFRLRPRGSTVLSGIKITAVIVGKVGSASPVPVIQPITDGVQKIVEYCETARTHKKDCNDLKEVVLAYADMLGRVTEGTSEEKMDPHLAYALAELDDKLSRIHNTMQELSRKGFVKRVFSLNKDAEQLSEHRRMLQDAMTRFQMWQIIRAKLDIGDINHNLKSLGQTLWGRAQVSSALFFLGFAETRASLAS